MLIVYVRRLLDRFLPPIDSETEGTFDKWVKKKRDEKLGKT
jgi:hypothetical protein